MRYFVRVLTAVLVAAAMTTVWVSKAQAGFITSLGQIQVDGTTNWNQFGPTGTILAGGDWAMVNGVPNTSVSVWGTSALFGAFERLDEGAGSSGNFTTGTPLLWSVVGGGGLPEWRFDFLNSTTGTALPVSGFGMQYQFSPYTPFGVDLSVYSENGSLLGTRNYTGVSSNVANGSALFLGMTSDQRDIGYFTLTSTTQLSNFSNSSLVGPLYVQADPQVSPVPEPASILLLGTGALALAGYARRKRKTEVSTGQSEQPAG